MTSLELPRAVARAHAFDLTDRVAVVTGATSGIGRAIAIGLAQHGADVVPTGRRTDGAADTCGEIQRAGRATFCFPTDITDPESIEALHNAVLDHFGRVDILVNAAGLTFKQPTLTTSAEQWSSLMDTNVTGVLRACQVFHGSLRASGRGRIVNLASGVNS